MCRYLQAVRSPAGRKHDPAPQGHLRSTCRRHDSLAVPIEWPLRIWCFVMTSIERGKGESVLSDSDVEMVNR